MTYPNGIANVLVKDLPGLEPGKIIVADPKAMKRVVEIVPDTKPAHFSMDKWDFSSCYTHINSPLHVIHFERADIDSRFYIKCYALGRMEAGFKIRTISANVIKLISIINRATELAGNFYCIQAEQLMEALGLDRTKQSYALQKLSTLICFYEEAEANGLEHLVDMEALHTTRIQLQDRAKYERHQPKPDIPEAFYDKMITVFDDVMRDESAPMKDRLTAGIMLVESQLGLRSNEICALPVNCLHWTLTSLGKKPYIMYRSIKGARNSQEFKWVEHICTPLLKKTLDYYLKLRKTVRGADVSGYLYFNPEKPGTVVKNEFIRKRYHSLMGRYFPGVEQPVEGIPMRKLRECGNKPLCIPMFGSFRVHVFSTLANQGLPYPFIEKIMSHSPQSRCDDSYYGGVKPDRNAVEKRILPDISFESLIPVLSR